MNDAAVSKNAVVFNGFGEIMLNNMNALYEAEKGYLDKLFAMERSKNDLAVTHISEGLMDPNFTQNVFYPKLLQVLLRVKSGLGHLN